MNLKLKLLQKLLLLAKKTLHVVKDVKAVIEKIVPKNVSTVLIVKEKNTKKELSLLTVLVKQLKADVV